MTLLAAYLLLFVAVGVGFILVHLLAGKLIRPNKPYEAKRTIYECGEPTIGSAWIQFDLRFYVVALLFVIFDVEVAFFFPWAVVFGKANALAAFPQPSTPEGYQELADRAWELVPPTTRPQQAAHRDHLMDVQPADPTRLQELQAKSRAARGDLPPDELDELKRLEGYDRAKRAVVETLRQARLLSWLALVEIAVFFGVLLVGYAYLWKRGDLAWVRSLAAERPNGEGPSSPAPMGSQPASAPLAGTGAHS
jgi:NADH-quinone oxidoreductase subunit A